LGVTSFNDHGDILVTMKTIAAGEFKAKCLQIMDEVDDSGEAVIITKRGVAVAKLVPVFDKDPNSIFGCMQGRMEIVGDLSISPWEEEFGDRDPILEKWDRLNK
jgi:prevent-host-death family protein